MERFVIVALASTLSLSHCTLAIDLDDDELVTTNGAAVSLAIIAGLSGSLLLLLYILLKVSLSPRRDVQIPSASTLVDAC